MAEETKAKAVAVVVGNSMLTDTARFEHSYRVARMFAGSQLVPKHLQGKVEDLMIALNIADRLGEDPLTVMQSIYIVSGRAGWSSSYMIARINQSGLIKGSITWDVTGAGKDLTVTAKAYLSSTGELVHATCSMQMAIAEGWTSNKKYASMPELMLRYRSAAMLQRLYFPQVMLGMRTIEEVETEATEAPRDITPPRSASAALEAFAAAKDPDIVPEMVVASDVPPDGPNVFDVGDDASAAALEERTGVKREEATVVVDEGAGELFDPREYLDHSLGVLATMKTPEEVGGANLEVKKTLKDHPELLGEWNSARFTRLSQMTPKPRKG